MQLRYNHIEAALAELTGVKPKDMGAFRGRLRHLRNIGLPRLPNPGSGMPIAYTRPQVLEMLLALELENKVGRTPKAAVLLAQSITHQAPYGQHVGKDCHLGISDISPAYQIAYGSRARNEMSK